MCPSPMYTVQSLPPPSHTSSLLRCHKPPPPACVSNTSERTRTLCVASSADETSGKTTRPSSDNYHATLRALNCKGQLPRKSLGQHYMLNSDINEQLARAARVEEGDVVLEIGPGTGSLTYILLNAGAFVLAVEKDKHMADLVSERFLGTEKLKVLTEDIVRCHVRSHILSLFDSIRRMDPETRHAKV